MAEQRDGQGRAYITLAQFLKMIQAAESGGAAKALARTGAATVNGEREERPGRKLHQGDRVAIAGATHTVDVSAKPTGKEPDESSEPAE